MDKDEFHRRIKDILSANRGPNNSPDKHFHEVMDMEVQGRSGKTWDKSIAAQVIREFEWATGTQPKSNELPESAIKNLFKKYLEDRDYDFTPIPEDIRPTPDNYIEGKDRKYICEIKSPELKLDLETQVYKYKTTHRKILDFIHTAVKQFNSLNTTHDIPRVLVFTSISMQLNWKSFTDAIQGGVIDQKGARSPDLSKTQVYTNTLPLLSEVDLYIWLQVSKSGDKFYQASYIINEKSKHIDDCMELVRNLSKIKVSNMRAKP
ncbi:hypothetical protein EBZ38_08955 [bacterium]|nr:hypothetical protein [bacterium]